MPLDDTPFEQAKFPFKLLQYLALGVPAVSARVGVARDVIEHGRNGLLAASPAEWRAALEQLIADAALRQRIAAAGRETVAAQLHDRTSRPAAGRRPVQRQPLRWPTLRTERASRLAPGAPRC